MEEQTAATNEISRNVAEAARGSAEIAQNITGVAAAARDTTTGANDLKRVSVAFTRMAGEIRGAVAAESE